MKGIVFGMGFLGTRIAKEFNFKQVGREVDPLNISILKEFLDKEKPDIVINAIGKTGGPGAIGIDYCETHKEETLQSNVAVPLILSTECNLRGIYFVHLGSGCMYQGDNNGKGFSEEDEPNFYGPQFYAKSKILSEKILKELPALILRIRMPIDNIPNERNLIDKIKKYQKLIDIPNSMTTVPQLILVLKTLMEKRKTGIYNVVNPGTISPAEIMQMYQRIIDPNHKFEILSLDGLNNITKANRSNCVLSSKKLNDEGIDIPEIHLAVEECLLNYKKYL